MIFCQKALKRINPAISECRKTGLFNIKFQGNQESQRHKKANTTHFGPLCFQLHISYYNWPTGVGVKVHPLGLATSNYIFKYFHFELFAECLPFLQSWRFWGVTKRLDIPIPLYFLIIKLLKVVNLGHVLQLQTLPTLPFHGINNVL